MTSDPDWIREREIDREIQARDEQVDRQFRELRESEQVQKQQPSPYESKRHSRIRTSASGQLTSGQLSFDSPYEPVQVEGEELPYIVTDEDAQHSRKSSRNPQLYISEAENEAAAIGGGVGVVGARYLISVLKLALIFKKYFITA